MMSLAPNTATPQLVTSGFGQEENQLGFAFVVENPQPDLSLTGVEYQVVAQAEDGTVLGLEQGDLPPVLPGQPLTWGGVLFLTEAGTVAQIAVTLSPGTLRPTQPAPVVLLERLTQTMLENSAQVTACLYNLTPQALLQVPIVAVAHNLLGEIVGGGFTLVSCALPYAHTGLNVPIIMQKDEDLAQVVLHPATSQSTLAAADAEAAGPLVQVTQIGFGQRKHQVGVGLTMLNPHPTATVQNLHYRLVAYGAAGQVLAVDEGDLDELGPRAMVGLARTLLVVDETPVAHLETQCWGGELTLAPAFPTFTFENIQFDADTQVPKLVAEIHNPSPHTAMNLQITALVLDAAGALIGCGLEFAQWVPAEASCEVNVYLIFEGEPARFELYASRAAITVLA